MKKSLSKARVNSRKGTHAEITLKRLVRLHVMIDLFIKANQYPPSFEEILEMREGDGTHVIPPHTSVISYYLGLMEQFGMIERHKGEKRARARAITLCPPSKWDVTMQKYARMDIEKE